MVVVQDGGCDGWWGYRMVGVMDGGGIEWWV